MLRRLNIFGRAEEQVPRILKVPSHKGGQGQGTHLHRYRKRCLDECYDYMIKLIVIGDSGVGKTNIISRFCDGSNSNYKFRDTHNATIGVDFSVRIINIGDKKIKLQIWDTAGQQRFKNLTETYYKGAAGILLTYSVDNLVAFQNVEKWIEQVNNKTSKSVKKILVANKIDLTSKKQVSIKTEEPEEDEKRQREVSLQKGIEMASKFGIEYYETSAKENIGINQIFYSISEMVKERIDQQERLLGESNPEKSAKSQTISLRNQGHNRNVKVSGEGIPYQYRVKSEDPAPPRNGCKC